MSRIANAPVTVPSGVTVSFEGQQVTVKGGNGELTHQIHEDVSVSQDDGVVKVSANNESKSAKALAGTTRAIINNLVVGVSSGFERKLEIVGVGYRAQMKPVVEAIRVKNRVPADSIKVDSRAARCRCNDVYQNTVFVLERVCITTKSVCTNWRWSKVAKSP